MAHMTKHNRGRALEGQVHGSKGATYYLTTDANGVISCSCPGWLFKKKLPIEDRVCKHLQLAFDSDGAALVSGKTSSGGKTYRVKQGGVQIQSGREVRKITFEEDEEG